MSYKAIIAILENVEKHPNADRLNTAFVLGYKVITGGDTKEGDVGVYFTCDSTLSHVFCHKNNLYRDKTKNIDTEKSGFFDDNRRVRAQALRGIKSDGYWSELSCLEYLNFDNNVEVGFEFDEYDGQKICEKYFSHKVQVAKQQNSQKPKKEKNIMFPEHFDTPQLQRVLHSIPRDSKFYITEKLHGTSHREGLVKVKRSLSLIDKIAKFIGVKVDEYQWEQISGSRRVVLGQSNKETGFHDPSIRDAVTELFKGNLHKGELIYLEIVGYEKSPKKPIVLEDGSVISVDDRQNAKPIMSAVEISLLKDKDFQKIWKPFTENGKMVYSYGCEKGNCDIYVYRITMINEDGIQTDLPFHDVMLRCNELGVKYVPVLYEGLYNGINKDLLEKVEKLSEGASTLDNKHIKEGVIVTIEGHSYNPMTFKYKSFEFKVLEGILKDNGAEDLEEIS